MTAQQLGLLGCLISLLMLVREVRTLWEAPVEKEFHSVDRLYLLERGTLFNIDQNGSLFLKRESTKVYLVMQKSAGRFFTTATGATVFNKPLPNVWRQISSLVTLNPGFTPALMWHQHLKSCCASQLVAPWRSQTDSGWIFWCRALRASRGGRNAEGRRLRNTQRQTCAG